MRNRPLMYFCLGVVVATVPLYLVACGDWAYPTVADINTLAAADHEFVAGEHQTTRDQMSAEHTVQTPEQSAALAQVNADAAAAVRELRDKVDAVQAKGADLGGLGGASLWEWLVTAMGGGGLLGWITNLFKPSRATGQINDLEKDTTSRIAALELALATAAKPGAAVPSDSPG